MGEGGVDVLQREKGGCVDCVVWGYVVDMSCEECTSIHNTQLLLLV